MNKPSNEINDAPILDQTREHWRKVAALVLFKVLGPGNTVNITTKDIQEFHDSQLVLYTHGHNDSITLGVVDRHKAKELVRFQETQRGHA